MLIFQYSFFHKVTKNRVLKYIYVVPSDQSLGYQRWPSTVWQWLFTNEKKEKKEKRKKGHKNGKAQPIR